MVAPISWSPGIFWFFLLETPHAHEIPRFRGGLVFVLKGGVEVPISFLWSWGFFLVYWLYPALKVADLDVTDLVFFGSGFRSARQMLCGHHAYHCPHKNHQLIKLFGELASVKITAMITD